MQKYDAHEVHNTCCDLNQEHLEREIIDLSVDVQELDDDQGREGYRDYVGIRVIEEKDTQHDYHRALEYALPDPDAEGLEVQVAASLKGTVQGRELEGRIK